MESLSEKKGKLVREAYKQKILLHICCAPDSTAVFERLSESYQVTGFFHNPNIFPQSEYQKRLEQTRKVAAHMGFPLISPPYEPGAWRQYIRGLEHEPEGGDRCAVCFRVNLRATARQALELQFPYFTTTLTISPHKDSKRIHSIGQEAGQEFGVEFLSENFKKKGGFQRSLELSKDLQLYRQKYCGCRYSLRQIPHAGTT